MPPRLRTTYEVDERHASWLELLFDLVLVVAITELSHQLVVDHSIAGFLRFAALFVPVYVAWQGYTFYATRFDTDDLAFRVAYFAAMLAIAALAVLIDDVARGEHSAGFAVAYVCLRSFMLALYARAWRAVAEARPLIRLYGSGYTAGVAIWLASLAVDPPLRYVVSGIALWLELSLPPLSTRIHRRVPTSGSHVPERWALLTPIVLGESVAAVALRTADANWQSADRGAGEEQLGAGPSTALLGGVIVYLVSLVATRSVTVARPRRVGVFGTLGAAAIILGLLLVAEGAVPPVALAAGLAFVLAAVVFAERMLTPASTPTG